jgi:hypothetical protein
MLYQELSIPLLMISTRTVLSQLHLSKASLSQVKKEYGRRRKKLV